MLPLWSASPEGLDFFFNKYIHILVAPQGHICTPVLHSKLSFLSSFPSNFILLHMQSSSHAKVVFLDSSAWLLPGDVQPWSSALLGQPFPGAGSPRAPVGIKVKVLNFTEPFLKHLDRISQQLFFLGFSGHFTHRMHQERFLQVWFFLSHLVDTDTCQYLFLVNAAIWWKAPITLAHQAPAPVPWHLGGLIPCIPRVTKASLLERHRNESAGSANRKG